MTWSKGSFMKIDVNAERLAKAKKDALEAIHGGYESARTYFSTDEGRNTLRILRDCGIIGATFLFGPIRIVGWALTWTLLQRSDTLQKLLDRPTEKPKEVPTVTQEKP
jgi:hypothetical protein